MFLHSRDLTLLRASRRAMATTFEIAFPDGTPHAYEAGCAALDLIEEIEEQLTVYRDSGEVARLNAGAADGPVAVERDLFQLLERCGGFTLDTAGAFDVAVGALVDTWAGAKRDGRIPTAQELNEATARSGFRHVMLSSGVVQFRRPGLKLNFGAIGKGYALDRAAELLRRDWGIDSALLQGGGSSMYGLGTPPTDLRGWPIAIRHPERDRPILGTVFLKNQGFGTSAATFQFFELNGKKYGHVLDPRTGRPAEGAESASCLADSAEEADAISTAFFVAGTEWAAEFCRSRSHVGAVMLEGGSAAWLGFLAPPG